MNVKVVLFILVFSYGIKADENKNMLSVTMLNNYFIVIPLF